MLEIDRPIPSQLVLGCSPPISARIASWAMYGASRKNVIATSRWARCSACSESRRLPVKRQMTMIEANPSIAESRPNPSSATEPARIAAMIATAPSTVM